MAQDLLLTTVSHYIRHKIDLPLPRKVRGKGLRVVPLPALARAKIAPYQELQRSGVCKAELARRMGQPKQQIERLLDLNHASRLDQIEAALAVLGKRLEVAVAAA